MSDKKAELEKPLPSEAISQHPTKAYLSTIKAVYVSQRLNDVWGAGNWSMDCEVLQTIHDTQGKRPQFTIVVKGWIEYQGKKYHHFGGSTNDDFGDAYKGALTDAMTKIASSAFEQGFSDMQRLIEAS